MSALTFTVVGTPAPQGSKRHVGNGVMVESSKAVKPWRQDVKAAALEATGGAPFPHLEGNVQLLATFRLPRPKSHYRTGTHAHELRPAAPRTPGTKPDLDKLLRSTMDALTEAGVFADDSRVVSIVAAKSYAGKVTAPGATITVVAAS